MEILASLRAMPSWELFDEQDAAYRREVLGVGTVCIGIEAALRFGWDQYLGERGGFIGMRGFGLCASAECLYEHFGITPAAIAAQAKCHL